jgi:hypothetical protein
MAEEKKEKWMTYLALTTVLIAVCATLSTFKGGGFSSRSLLNQTLASNQWALFQSKSIKSYIFENQIDNLEIQQELVSKSANSKEDIAKYQVRIDSYKKKIKQYEEDKAEAMQKAKAFEKVSELSKKHGESFGIAVIFLQIAILLSSIGALTKKRMVWYLSLAVGALGVVYFFDGFWMFL